MTIRRSIGGKQLFGAVAVVRCVAVVIVSCAIGFAWNSASGQSGKTKSRLPGLPRVAAYSEEEFAKYATPLTGDESPIAIGRSVTVSLVIGKVFPDVEITESQLGKGDETLKALTIYDPIKKKPVICKCDTISNVATDDHDYSVLRDPAKKGHVLFDTTRRDADINERLKETGHFLWPEPTELEQTQTLEEYKQFLDSVQKQYPFPMRVYESKYFLVCTDIPEIQFAPYGKNLDLMYAELCKAFGIPKDKNIWRGKCLIIAFTTKESFQSFERVVMKNNDVEGAQGLHHSASDGRAMTVVYRGNDPAYFGVVLVHETSHGFLHRLRSNVEIPPWIDEGIADWIAGYVMRPCKSIMERQKDALEIMKQTGRMGANFFDADAVLNPQQYGIASSLTNFMLTQDPTRYREFIVGIKEGHSTEESLRRSFGVSPAELINQFGRPIGVLNLRP